MKQDIDKINESYEEAMLFDDGLITNKNLNKSYEDEYGAVNEGLTVFETDEEKTNRRKRKAKNQILLENKQIRQQFSDSNRKINKR